MNQGIFFLSGTRMLIKFFNDFDIFLPSICKCPFMIGRKINFNHKKKSSEFSTHMHKIIYPLTVFSKSPQTLIDFILVMWK
jgi:hypothetical protein